MIGVLVLFSLFLFFRGHDEPGGGFIGGLVGAGAFTLYAIAFGPEASRRVLRIQPITLIALGLLSLVVSGFIPMLNSDPFRTGKWLFIDWGAFSAKVSTPLLFDIGVCSYQRCLRLLELADIAGDTKGADHISLLVT